MPVSTTHFHSGAQSFAVLGSTTADITYDFGAQSFTKGTRYILDFWLDLSGDHLETTVTFGDDGGDQESVTYTGVSGDDPPGLFEETEVGADGNVWNRARVCWTPSATRTSVRVRVQITGNGSQDFFVDDLVLYTTDNDPHAGTETRAARCDHGHLAESLKTNEKDTSRVLKPDGVGGVAWAVVSAGGAPTVVYDQDRYSGGDITVSTQIAGAALPGPGTVTVAAAAGDILQIGLSVRTAGNPGGSLRIDAATIVAAAVVNYVGTLSSTPSNGIAGWFLDAESGGNAGVPPLYVVQAGDLDAGTVTLSLRAWVTISSHTLLASTNDPLVFWVRNLGAPA